MQEWLLVFGLLLIAGGALFLVWQVPRWQIARSRAHEPKDELDLEIKARSSVAQIVGGVVLIIGAFSTVRSFMLARDQQVTDRFTKAVAQLGEESRAVRIGGVYALERIAEDSSRDRPAVVQVLAAYIRDQRPWECDYPGHKRCKERAAAMHAQLGTPRADLDVQAAVTALLAQSAKIATPHLVDLSNCDLRGLNFTNGNLRNVVLNKSYLGGAKFAGADLRNAKLAYACIPEYSEFEDAELAGFDMAGAMSSGAPILRRTIERAKTRPPSREKPGA